MVRNIEKDKHLMKMAKHVLGTQKKKNLVVGVEVL
jgi:hypothetical protein